MLTGNYSLTFHPERAKNHCPEKWPSLGFFLTLSGISVTKHVPQSLLLSVACSRPWGTRSQHWGMAWRVVFVLGGCAWGMGVGKWARRPRAGWQEHSTAAWPSVVWFCPHPPKLDAFPNGPCIEWSTEQTRLNLGLDYGRLDCFAWRTSVPWSPWPGRGAPTRPRGCGGGPEREGSRVSSAQRTGCVFSPTRCSLSIPTLISLGGEAEAFIIFKRPCG